MPTEPVSRPWCRYLRLSVRGLIVLVLVVGLALGWIVRSARIQREAVAAIENAGGNVSYDWEWSNGKNIMGGKPWAPRWLVDLIGVDYVGHVAFVRLTPNGADDAVMVHVGRLKGLQLFTYDQSGFDCVFSSPTLSDAGLSHLTELTNLSVLWLSDTQATDAGLVHLAGMTQLSYLHLSGARITGAGLAHLKGLTKLTYLCVSKTQLTDGGLAHLKGLQNLSGLDLEGTQVTDLGLMNLKNLTNLSTLILDGTRVSDSGLAQLKGLTKITSLSLSSTPVTDAGLAHLTGLTNLSVLWLNDTQVTDAGTRTLKQALPSVMIYR